MKSRTSCWNICFLIFATYMPQGYTLRRQYIDIEGIVEPGSNITEILKKIMVSSPHGHKVYHYHHPQIPYLSEDSGEWKKHKEAIAKHISDYSKETGEWVKKLNEAIAKSIFMGLFGTSKENEKNTGRSGLWSAAQTFITNLAIALSDHPHGQAIGIVQPSKETKQYSLLQDIRSGRIRGPVHVYGRHAGRSRDSSDDD